MTIRRGTALIGGVLAVLLLGAPPVIKAQTSNDYTLTTFAGTPGPGGSTDGTGSEARFNSPRGLAVDSAGNVYVADRFNHIIRKITPAGVVTTLAGTAGVRGSIDAVGAAASFNNPWGVAVDGTGHVYVSDADNNTIRKITPDGTVTTLAGLAGQAGSADGTGSEARFDSPRRPAVDAAGNVYVADRDNHTIRKITPGGVVTTFAGAAGQNGSTDATGTDARFNLPSGVAVDAAGNVYVADTNNSTIRKITPAGVVTTMAGLALVEGSVDGFQSDARFDEPEAVAVDAAGNVYVADTDSSVVRRVTPDGHVTTVAGLAYTEDSTDGTGSEARMHQPRGIAAEPSGVIYISDTDNNTIRRGQSVVPTITSHPGSQTIPFGSTATLSVTAIGPGPLAYQWFQGVSPSQGSPIAGATGPSYTTAAMAASRSYWVLVTNVWGTFASATATVTVTGLGPQTVQNADFSNGQASWNVHELPDMVFSIVDGVFKFHRASPVTASGQATVFQNTGLVVSNGQGLVAQFDIGNEDSVRKRLSVLVVDADFGDLSVCTFWLPPNAALTTYQMNTHPTRNWANAAIYFYAATNGPGDYLLDNVSLRTAAAASSSRTECLDPTAPAPTGGPVGPTLLSNGDFSAPTLPPWGAFFDLTHQLSGGVFEFIRPGTPGQPAGGILQSTGQAMTAGEILTATFQLGNSSSVRKRVTVLLHDLNFSDLAACTFWIAPGQPLSDYAVRSFTTKPWTNATVSFYAASIGPQQWTRLDNASLNRTPGTAVLGTECLEPGSSEPPALASVGPTRPDSGNAGRVARSTPLPAPIDLTSATHASLTFDSGSLGASAGRLEVSRDGVDWETIATFAPGEGWLTVEIDLSNYAGQRIYLRFVSIARAGQSPS